MCLDTSPGSFVGARSLARQRRPLLFHHKSLQRGHHEGSQGRKQSIIGKLHNIFSTHRATRHTRHYRTFLCSTSALHRRQFTVKPLNLRNRILLSIMTRSISIASILLLFVSTSYAFQPSAPSTTHRSVTKGKASSSALFEYVPKWKKKETLADSAGDMSADEKGLVGTIPVVFKQGNETRRTLASPGQPLSFVAAQAGQPIRYGCKKGECGTCECMANGKWIRPCVESVPDWAPGQELVLNIKALKNKSKSSGKFYSVKSFFMGFYNNFVGMFGFVKQRKAAKKNWEERQEYEHLVKVLTAEKKAARLAREAEEAEELQLEIAAVLKKEAEAAEAQRVKLTAEVAEEREAAGVHQIR